MSFPALGSSCSSTPSCRVSCLLHATTSCTHSGMLLRTGATSPSSHLPCQHPHRSAAKLPCLTRLGLAGHAAGPDGTAPAGAPGGTGVRSCCQGSPGVRGSARVQPVPSPAGGAVRRQPRGLQGRISGVQAALPGGPCRAIWRSGSPHDHPAAGFGRGELYPSLAVLLHKVAGAPARV